MSEPMPTTDAHLIPITRTEFRALALTLALGAAFVGGVYAGHAVPADDPAPTTVVHPSDRIEEDDPRWDCVTMGNGQCGPADVNL